LDEFWANLVGGRDSVTDVPADRWDHAAIFNPEPGKPGRTYGRWGGFLSGIDLFDPAFFGISRREAERMDPPERLFLTQAWQVLEDAGYPPAALAGGQVGVFVGVMWNHYQLVEDPDDGVAPVAMHASIANRVSYTFDLGGPSMAVDTACSSSLTAIHLAVESIRRGEKHTRAGRWGQRHAASRRSTCNWRTASGFRKTAGAFGAGGTGYVPGEGVGAVLLKPLSRALADGDHVHAVIRGSRLNHSGRPSGFTLPSPTAQAELICSAVQSAGVDPGTIGYVEAHGTGTSLGDPIELRALRRAFEDLPGSPAGCAIGSVKSNIGHLESAAGIAALTKVVPQLQLRHGTLAPSLHAETLNPELDLEGSTFSVQRSTEPWPQPVGGRRRAGISAFGAGGANAHLVVEESPELPADRPPPRGPQFVVLSGRDEQALRDRARALLAHLDRQDDAGGAQYRAAETRLRVRHLVADRLDVPADAVDGGETLDDLGFDPAGLAALAAEAGIGTGDLGPEYTVDDLAARCARAGDPVRLDDLAHTLRVGRAAMHARFAVVTSGLGHLRAALGRLVRDEAPGPTEHRCTAPAAGTGDVSERWRAGDLSAVARTWVEGADVDWSAAGPAGARRIPLPGYPFGGERCWLGNWRSRSEPLPKPVAVPAPTTVRTMEKPLAENRTGEGVDLQVLDGGIALLRLRQPTFTADLVNLLEERFAEVAERPDVRVVVVTGSGPVFTMGADHDALERLAGGEGRFTDHSFLFEGPLRCERPVIAAIQEHAAGGGLAFGLYADILVMAEDASYSANFVNYGFTPGMGATYILERRFGVDLATEMMLTGRAVRQLVRDLLYSEAVSDQLEAPWSKSPWTAEPFAVIVVGLWRARAHATYAGGHVPQHHHPAWPGTVGDGGGDRGRRTPIRPQDQRGPGRLGADP
jgi:acyl transferase domain-containing protein